MKSTLTAALLALFCLSCGKQEDEAVTVAPAPPGKVPFVVPVDSMVTVGQMKNWLRCNALLDSLSYIYRDSFAVEDPARLTAYQRAFVKAQDKLCVVTGLTGGYDEYLWVLQNAGHPRNKHILDSADVAGFQ